MSNDEYITVKLMFVERPEGLLLIVTAEHQGQTVRAAVVDHIPPDDWCSIRYSEEMAARLSRS